MQAYNNTATEAYKLQIRQEELWFDRGPSTDRALDLYEQLDVELYHQYAWAKTYSSSNAGAQLNFGEVL